MLREMMNLIQGFGMDFLVNDNNTVTISLTPRTGGPKDRAVLICTGTPDDVEDMIIDALTKRRSALDKSFTNVDAFIAEATKDLPEAKEEVKTEVVPAKRPARKKPVVTEDFTSNAPESPGPIEITHEELAPGDPLPVNTNFSNEGPEVYPVAKLGSPVEETPPQEESAPEPVMEKKTVPPFDLF